VESEAHTPRLTPNRNCICSGSCSSPSACSGEPTRSLSHDRLQRGCAGLRDIHWTGHAGDYGVDHVRRIRFRPWCAASGEGIPRFAKFCPAQLSHRSASERTSDATRSLRAALSSILPFSHSKSRTEILSVQKQRCTALGNKGFLRCFDRLWLC
jgi:hypothetical protein